ncbi:uncharacterized protein LOC108461988 isoform X2 [Gossypium arboreum]|uniref:uncharacterized protein LOC108461988 isoform X2 n=1 Tax=Gossypium arboreum TaxID=29729 RepID=UPI000818FAD4|nr:uncharacterized protein LOC108461988 isoform X2 [Gossypium arboreum]
MGFQFAELPMLNVHKSWVNNHWAFPELLIRCRKPVKKVGKNEHHLWKERDSTGSGQKALNLDRIRIQYAKTKSDCIAKMMETLFPEKRRRSKKKKVNDSMRLWEAHITWLQRFLNVIIVTAQFR